MTYAETLNYLYNTLPMFSHMGSAAFKKDLVNIKLLCDRLHNPERTFKTIHVAGTNGKGSVSHMMAAIFQKAGLKTGLYTSPHLYDLRERIRINGEMVSKEFVTKFTTQLKPFIETVQPSFFEITVAMAFEAFAQQTVDVAVIEVGLGGRLDSTNIITPELSIITNIGWDHMNILGNSLAEIAAEKGGIIKANIPVVIGETVSETRRVFESIAAKKHSPVFFAEELFQAAEWVLHSDKLEATFTSNKGEKISAQTDLPGFYQVKNIRTVLTAVDVLKGLKWNLNEDVVLTALKETKKLTGLHGRWEVIRKKPDVVLEVAHNRNGMEQMLEHLAAIKFSQLHIVFGMVKDKDTNGVLSLLPQSAHYYFTQAAIPRALEGIALKEKAALYQLLGETYSNVNLALKTALAKAGEDDLIMVCGSIFLVAEVDRESVTARLD